MIDFLDEKSSIESTTVGIYRTAATVKGGRRFSFSSLVVVGDRAGRVGLGYSKANQVPQAIEKAQKEGKRKMREFPLQKRTLPHAVTGRFGACSVRMVPASPGTGVLAGAAVRAVLELVGVQDCLTKSYGSTNPKNLVKAAMNGLEQLRSKEQVEALRGVSLPKTTVEESIERSSAFMVQREGSERAKAPVNTVGQDKKRGRPGRGGRGGGGGGGGGGRGRGRRSQTDMGADSSMGADGGEGASEQN
jgi:small subunit ribosomal protein S5